MPIEPPAQKLIGELTCSRAHLGVGRTGLLQVRLVSRSPTPDSVRMEVRHHVSVVAVHNGTVALIDVTVAP